jgi:signal transduction histidine kinase
MLIYALYVGTILSRGISHTGIVNQIFPDSGSATNYLMTGLGMQLGVAIFIILWDKILDLRKNFPIVHNIYWLVATAMAASALFVMSEHFSFFARAGHATMLVASITSIVLAMILARREPANVLLKFYLFAFLPVALVWATEIAARISPLVPVDLGRLIHEVSTMLHIAILSVALAYRLKDAQREQMRAEAALAGEQLARQHQRTFIDMANHEFKTPLAVIDSAAQMLELVTAPDRPDIAARTTIIRRSVQRLVDLLETCLVADRDESLALRLEPVSPEEILGQLAERNRDMHQPAVIVTAPVALKPCLADSGLLGIALDALVDNARRYGPTDHPVEVTAQAEGKRVTFVIQDRGPGIPADEVELIFDKYYRCASSGAVPGTGIGLHLVKTITDLHGGKVAYTPRTGGGASFALTIPTIG